MSIFRDLFLAHLLEDVRQDEPGIVQILAVEVKPDNTVRVIAEDNEQNMFFFDHDGTFESLLAQMLNPGLAESST